MKFISKTTLLMMTLIASGVFYGQKNQTEQYNALAGATFKEMGGSTYAFRSEKNQAGNVHIFMTETYKSGNVADEKLFVPDNEAFPATFVSARDRSLGTPLAELKVIGTNTQSTDKRLVFVEDELYIIWYWNSKSSFKIQRVLKAKKAKSEDGGKKKGGGLKAFKAAMAASKQTDEEQMAPLKEYLNLAIAKQEELTPAWEKENKGIVDQKAKNKKSMDEYVNKVNSDYWNSEEGQRKLKEMRQPDVIIRNDTGGDLWLCYGQGASSKLEPGDTKSFSCTGGSVYRGTPVNSSQAEYSSGDKMMSFDGSKCGVTVNASSIMP